MADRLTCAAPGKMKSLKPTRSMARDIESLFHLFHSCLAFLSFIPECQYSIEDDPLRKWTMLSPWQHHGDSEGRTAKEDYLIAKGGVQDPVDLHAFGFW